MSYYSSSLAHRLKDALHDFGVHPNDHPSLVQVYQLIHLLIDTLPPISDLSPANFYDVLNDGAFPMASMPIAIFQFSPARCSKLYTLYKLVRENSLDNDPIRFFQLVAPGMVSDWSGFLASLGNSKDWERILPVLYHILTRTFRICGTNAVFDTNPGKIVEDIINADLLDEYSIESLENCVRSALYIELDSPVVRQSKNFKRKLSELVDKITSICDSSGDITAHTCILNYIAKKELTSNEALNKELKRLQKIRTSDIIRQFRSQTQSDESVELKLVLPKFLEISKSNMLIYNPSPTVLMEYSRIGGILKNTVFVIPDMLEAQAYQRQFSGYIIYGADTLPDTIPENLLVFDSDGNLPFERYKQLLTKCTSINSQLLIYAPQTKISNINSYMMESGLYIEAILGLPTGISQSTPAKKALLFGSSNYCEVVRITQAERNTQIGRGKTGLPFLPVNALYLSRKYVEIPTQQLDQDLTVLQMMALKQDTEIDARTKHQGARTYAWSREIHIFYATYSRDNNILEGRAYVKSVSMVKGKICYGKRICKLKTQGLRGKSVDAILEKLPTILFEPDLYNAYVPILEKLYDDSPDGLSLKTVWYMLWGDLWPMTSYNDSICRELFCGECQELSNINPVTATVESILEALEVVCGIREIPDAYLKQLCLIFKLAVDRNFFSENKFKHVITRVRTQKSETENLMSRLRKRTTTDAEVKRILAMLTESDSGFPRYASSSECFFMAISLFAPISLVHLRALRWNDISLDDDLCSISISRKMTRDDRIIDIGSPFSIPCSPIISMIITDRLNYLSSKWPISAQMLSNEPIFWECDPRSKSALKRTLKPISHATAKKLQKDMISIAGIRAAPTQVSDRNNSHTLDLNDTYLRNFWHNNVVTQAALRGLERGEVSYLLGKTPVDTVDAHYFGFDAPYNQMRMAAIQHRWTAPYEALLRPTTDSPGAKELTVDKDADLLSCHDLGKRSFMYFEIHPCLPGDIQIEINSQFGHTAVFTQIEDLDEFSI